MRLKSFYAKNMTEAMQMVRDTLGEDAVIVATREEKGSNSVHVTAAIEPQNEPAFEVSRSQNAAPADDWLQYDDEIDEEENAIAEELTDVLIRHGVPEELLDHIISCATIIGMDRPGNALVAAIEHLYNFKPLPQNPHQKAIMMVGPPGSGKTLAAAKMAARGVMNGIRVGVISTDTQRAGGIEQLSAFTALLNIDLKKAETPRDLRYIMADMDDDDQVIIDTAGINPFDTQDVKMLAKLVAAADIQPYLVLPGGIDPEESTETARIFQAIGVHSLIPTRIDIARRLGGILSAAYLGGLAFADGSNTPKVADGFVGLTPRSISKMLIPRAFKNKASTIPSGDSSQRPSQPSSQSRVKKRLRT